MIGLAGQLVEPGPPMAGAPMTWEITLANSVDSPATVASMSPLGLTVLEPSCVGRELPGKGQLVCQATATLSQVQIDAGLYVAGVSFELYYPAAETTVLRSTTGTVVINRAPGLTFTETVSHHSYHSGTELAYTLEVQNTGNVTLEGVTVTAVGFTGFGGTAAFEELPLQIGTIEPGQSYSTQTYYTAGAVDVAQGSIAKTVMATAASPCGSELATTSESLTYASSLSGGGSLPQVTSPGSSTGQPEGSPAGLPGGSPAGLPGGSPAGSPGGSPGSWPGVVQPGAPELVPEEPIVVRLPKAEVLPKLADKAGAPGHAVKPISELAKPSPVAHTGSLAYTGTDAPAAWLVACGLMLMGIVLVARRSRQTYTAAEPVTEEV